jgi:transposase-like protein
MADTEFSIPQLAQRLRTEADAYRFLEDLRWGDKPVCPHCDSERQPYFLTPRDGVSRRTRTGSSSERRVWKCAGCRKQFSVLTGTIFHGSKIPVRTWVMVVFEMCASKNGVAAREIERKYGLSTKAAWFLLHRVREAMKRDPMAGLLSGRVVSDETWFGGTPRFRHAKDRRRRKQGDTDKTPIVALVCHETGEVRSRAIPNVTGETLLGVLQDEVDVPQTHLHTDEYRSYRRVAQRADFASHSVVNHIVGEYVRAGVSTNKAENYFSQLKRSLDGTHHHVSRDHLVRYLAEFDFRYSTCKKSDTERMRKLLARQVAGRRLTYRAVV